MNIFYLDRNPEQAAQWLVDKHVNKMILESCQLLSTAHRVLDGELFVYETGNVVPNKKLRLRKIKKYMFDSLDPREQILLKATHINHPCAKWIRESELQYLWLHRHTVALANEYSYRYGKIHKYHGLIHGQLSLYPQNIPFPIKGFVDPPCAMDDQYKISNDAVTNYRNYYNIAKRHYYIKGKQYLMHKWKKRSPPPWIT